MFSVYMAVLVQIRDVDAAVRDELKARATRAGVSFNAYLRDLLTEAAARPTREAVLARIASRSEAATRSSVEFVRAEREQRSTTVTDPA